MTGTQIPELEVDKTKVVVEDIQVGLNTITQNRGNKVLDLTELNASQLLGMLVVDNEKDLAILRTELMPVHVVYVIETNSVYVFDKAKQSWTTTINGVYVFDDERKLPDIKGYKLAFNTANKLFYVHNGSAWVSNDTHLLLVDDSADLTLLPEGVDMVLTRPSGKLMHKGGYGWEQVALGTLGDSILILDNVGQLPQEARLVKTAYVKDEITGGWFCYDESKKTQSDNGINYHGWIRQGVDRVNVKWFGAVGDGINDDTDAFIAAFAHEKVLVPKGNYSIEKPVTVRHDIDIIGEDAKITFKQTGHFNFIGTLQLTPIWSGKLTANTKELQLSSTSATPDVGSMVLIKDTSKALKTKVYMSHAALIEEKSGNRAILSKTNMYEYKTAEVLLVNAITVNVSGIAFESLELNSQGGVTLENTKNSTIENCRFMCAEPAINLMTTYDTSLINTNVNSTKEAINAQLSTKLNVIDSFIRGAVAFKFPNNLGEESAINDLLIENSELLPTTTDAISSESNVFGLTMNNSESNGKLSLGGANFKFTNSTLSSSVGVIKFAELFGGDIIVDSCKFTCINSSFTSLKFIDAEAGYVSGGFWYSTTRENILDTLTMCITNSEFNDPNEKAGAIVKLSWASPKSVVLPKASILVSNVKYNRPAYIYGPFYVNGMFSSIDLLGITLPGQSAYADRPSPNEALLDSAGSVGDSFTCDRFYTDFVFVIAGSWGSSVSDGVTSSIPNGGYRFVGRLDGQMFLFRALRSHRAAVHGRHLELVSFPKDFRMNGVIYERTYNGQYVLEVQRSTGLSGIPTNTDAFALVKLKHPVVINLAAISGGVI